LETWTLVSILVTIVGVSAAPPLPPRPQARPLVATDGGHAVGATPRVEGTASIERPVVSSTHPINLHKLEDRRLFEAGSVIAGKYLLERPAGFGGMAELWVATNQATRAEVCVKLLNPSGEDEVEAVERFHREARAAAKLSHRAIVRVFDLLELDENGEATKARPRAYAIVMELLHGETLGDLLAKRGKLPVDEALDLFLPVVSALAHAHRASVIHRDIKPDNIFLARDPDDQIIPKVLDFGVSKLENAETITIDGVLLGTPSFMSPEQARGARALSARSDVFSAGILFYVMLTGKNPFDDGPFASVVDAVLRREVLPVEGLAPEIWAVLQQAMEKDPERRFGDATEMGIALRKAAGRRASTESSPVLPAAPLSSWGVDSEPMGLAGSAPISGPPSSFTTHPESLAAKARWRRAIVASVVGCAAALVLLAGVATIRSSPKLVEPSAQAAVIANPPAAAVPTITAIASAPARTQHGAAPAPDTSDPEPPPVETNPPETKPAAVKTAARPTPGAPPVARPAAATPTKSSTAPTRTRRPGQEPHSARGPGF
jgi:eukaryotic-like serine/threonine-protein kinase